MQQTSYLTVKHQSFILTKNKEVNYTKPFEL